MHVKGIKGDFGTIRRIELDYPSIKLSDDLTLSPLKGVITATRTTEGIYIHGELESAAALECVRCLTETIVPLDFTLDELFYYPPQSAPPGENYVGEDGLSRRSASATHAEKSTVQSGRLNAVSSGTANGNMGALEKAAAAAKAQMEASVNATAPATDIKFCAIDDPGCEACQ